MGALWPGDVVQVEADTDDGADWIRKRKPPRTPTFSSRRGPHYLFRGNGTSLNARPADGVEVLSRDSGKRMLVLPPTPPKSWLPSLSPWDVDLVTLPPAFALRASSNGARKTAIVLGPDLPPGQAHLEMTRIVGKLAPALSPEELLRTATALNAGRLPEEELTGVVEAIAAKERAPEPAPADPRPLDEVVGVFRKWLELPDPSPAYIPVATIVANHQPGDPLWLVEVGPSGGGKTEGVQATTAIPHEVSTLTEAALLSGTPVKERARGSRGGLLREVGDFGILVVKDLGGILTLDRSALPRTLQALRDVYDGRWVRWVGTEGATALEWSGRVGFLAGSTPSIDRHHAIMAALGQRFVFYRLPRIDEATQSRAALKAEGREHEMRGELREAVAGLFAGLDLGTAPAPVQPQDPEYQPLIALARLSARARSVVERDWRTDDIELVPEPEMPARIAKALDRLRAGLLTIGVPRDEAWRLTVKTGLDSLPQARRAVLEHMVAAGEQQTSEVAGGLQLATRTCRRALEDLHSHRLLIREQVGGNKGDRWTATDLLLSLWDGLHAGDVGEPYKRDRNGR
jgi:hypothetical protein